MDDADALSTIAVLATRADDDGAWHELFRIAETNPAWVPTIERALSGWRDQARPMPVAWWSEIRRGEVRPYHRLVRNLGVAAGEGEVLRAPTARESLGEATLLSLRDADAVTAAMDAGFDRVRELELSRATLPVALVAELIVGATFPALRRLRLAALQPDPPHATPRSFGESFVDDPIPLDELAGALAGREAQRPKLDLELAAFAIDAAGMEAFARQPALRAIERLSFQFSRIGPAEIAALARAEHASGLSGLSLHLGQIGEAGVRALAAAPFFPKLRVLRLPNQRTTDALGDLLRDAGGTSSLEILELRHDELGSRTAAALATCDLANLRELALSFNALTDADVARIVRNPTLRSLVRLEVLGTGAAQETARAFVENRSLSALRSLNVGDQFGDEAAHILSSATTLRSLQRLQICGVTNEALEVLVPRLGLHDAFVTNRRVA